MSSTIDPEKFTYQLGVSEKDQEEWIKRYLQKIRENKEMAKYKEFQAATTTPEALKKSFSGVLEKGELGRGTLPPHEVAKQKSYNAKIKLQKLKERQQLRQQKRMSNESNFRNLY